MNGVAVDGVAVDLFVVVEDEVAPERTSANNMAVGQDVSKASVSASSLSRHDNNAPLTLVQSQQHIL